MPEPAVTLEAVAFAHAGSRVFSDLTLDIASAAVTAVVGANGSGKSTLLELIAGVLRPDRGRVRHGPTEVALAPQRSQVTDTFPSPSPRRSPWVVGVGSTTSQAIGR